MEEHLYFVWLFPQHLGKRKHIVKSRYPYRSGKFRIANLKRTDDAKHRGSWIIMTRRIIMSYE